MSSMTGFGRALCDAPLGRIVVEIQSVNRKYLEIFVSLPKEYSRFELDVRKKISEKVSRGQVTIRIHLFQAPAAAALVQPDFEVLKRLKEHWTDLARRLGYSSEDVNLPFLLQVLPPMKQEESSDEDFKPLDSALEEALEAFLKMKRTEGKALIHDISERLKLMSRTIDEIEDSASDAALKMKKKLQERIVEAAPHLNADDRVLREIAIFAEKVDISEELTRFRSHVVQFYDLLKEKAGIGRKMDFLVQEMGREINTIGSKSVEAKISHSVVSVKAELEKVREQIQNIE